MFLFERETTKTHNERINVTDDIDGKSASDRSQLVANETRVVSVVCKVRIDQSNRVLGIVSLNLQHH